MTPHPPHFESQMKDQKLWNDGFAAGVLEVLQLLQESVDKNSEDLEGPTPTWVKDFSDRISRRYL